MRDFYLRFADVNEMQLALLAFGFQEEEEQRGLYHPDVYLDVIGIMYEPVRPENENSGFIALSGYHVNVRVMNDGLDLSPLDEFIVTPKTPARVWA